MKRLKNKIALITGAAQGIGKATAQLFAEQGAVVIISDVNDNLANSICNSIGESAHYMHLDVSKEDEWKHVFREIINTFGGLDILVNNAGIMGAGNNFGLQDPEYCSLEDWRTIHAVNLDGTFLGCKSAIEVMKNKSGSIVNVSSRSGIVGVPGAAAYASSKAAIRNHTKSVALYCAQQKYNIRCNSVHPGSILTPLWEEAWGDHKEAAKEQIEAGIPLGRMGKPEEAAQAILFLASDESSFITGSEIIIDGGILAGSASAPKKH